MKRLLISLLLATGLAGCVTAAERERQFAETKQFCESHKVRVEAARCLNDAEDKIFGRTNHPDLVNLKHALRLELAAKVDKGQITKEEADTQFALAVSQMVSTANQRDAQSQQAAAASMAAGAAMQQANAPPPRLSTTCINMGSVVTCN
jgi:hypothetical protein